MANGGAIVPCLLYRDAAAAIEWLCDAFGFEKRMVVPGEDGTVVHSELVFRNGMVIVGTERDGEFGKVVRAPRSLGGTTQSPYIVVDDDDAHHARAVAAGAEIVIPLKTESYGGRGYTCRDPEGHVWSFGTYDPWKSPG